jgi:hypothetical protein
VSKNRSRFTYERVARASLRCFGHPVSTEFSL